MGLIAGLFVDQLRLLDLSNPLTYLDFLTSTALVVLILVYLRRFPVYRVVLGVLFLFACSAVFSLMGFVLTSFIFSLASTVILISIPLIFASEIRHYLGKLGRFSFIKIPALSHRQKDEVLVGNLAAAVFELAERKIGALIIIQRRSGLGDLIDTGIIIDAKLGAKILGSIFYPNSPLHDGAVVTVGNRIVAARCVITILPQIKLDPPFGTRHKAGLSITQETDAVAIMVSEQRGEVSLAENGKLEINLSQPALIERLTKLL